MLLRSIAVGCIMVGVVLCGLWYTATPTRHVLGTSGDLVVPPGPEQEARTSGFLFRNGYNIPNYPDCPMAETFARAELLLGPPVEPFNGQAMTFVYGRLRCVKADKGPASVIFDNLGYEDYRITGHLPIADSPASQPVRDHIRNALEMGVDPREVFGRIISPEKCDGDGTCYQYTDKQKLVYDKDAPGTAVAEAPLGCMAAHRCLRTESATAGRSWLLLILGIGCIGGGLGLMLVSRRRQGLGGEF